MDAHYWPAPGWKWKTLPFQREIADAFSDPLLETVTVLKSARVGFTKLLAGYFCYRIHFDPSGILAVLPAQEDAEGFSKDDIAPALEATPEVAGLVGDPKARDSANTILHKVFPGGFLKVVGAHSGRGFRRITTDVVAFDEVDAYPPSAGGEGDQIDLGKKRAFTSPFPKFIIGSSPKTRKLSRIWRSWEDSDQRDLFVPCPHCDHGQRLQWGGRDADFGIKWPKDRPEDAYYLCEQCREPIEHHQKEGMVAQGRWQTELLCQGNAGFRIWAGYSPFPAAAWGKLATEFLKVKDDPVRLQVFVNTILGEPWGDQYKGLDHERLMARRESYPVRVIGTRDDGSQETEPLVPRQVAILTAGVDIQDDRIEVQAAGYGRGEECWKLEYQVLYGDPSSQELWDELDDFLTRPRRMERGGWDYIRATAIDTGGHHTQTAYDFCRPRYRRLLGTRPGSSRPAVSYAFAIKGQTGEGTIWPREASRRNIGKVLLWPVRVDPAKDAVQERLNRIEVPGPGYIHFPRAFGEIYFEQLDSEVSELSHDRQGFPKRKWRLKTQGRRNEAWDTAIYDYVALRGLIDGFGFDLERECNLVASMPDDPDDDPRETVDTMQERQAALPAKKKASRRRWKAAEL